MPTCVTPLREPLEPLPRSPEPLRRSRTRRKWGQRGPSGPCGGRVPCLGRKRTRPSPRSPSDEGGGPSSLQGGGGLSSHPRDGAGVWGRRRSGRCFCRLLLSVGPKGRGGDPLSPKLEHLPYTLNTCRSTPWRSSGDRPRSGRPCGKTGGRSAGRSHTPPPWAWTCGPRGPPRAGSSGQC